MKTAISLPDETFTQAERYAAQLKISRSEFYARAAQRYINELETESESLTQQIDAALATIGDDDSSEAAVGASHRTLREHGGEW